MTKVMNDKQRLSQSAYAKHRHCSQPYISKLIGKKIIAVGPDGLINVAAADRILDARKRPKPGATTVELPSGEIMAPDSMSFAEAERRSKAAEALQRELKLAKMRDQCVTVQEHQQHLEEVATEARARFLNLPAKLWQRLQGCTDRVKFITTVETEIREALTMLGGVK